MSTAKLSAFSLPGFGSGLFGVFGHFHFSLNVLISKSEAQREKCLY